MALSGGRSLYQGAGACKWTLGQLAESWGPDHGPGATQSALEPPERPKGSRSHRKGAGATKREQEPVEGGWNHEEGA